MQSLAYIFRLWRVRGEAHCYWEGIYTLSPTHQTKFGL